MDDPIEKVLRAAAPSDHGPDPDEARRRAQALARRFRRKPLLEGLLDLLIRTPLRVFLSLLSDLIPAPGTAERRSRPDQEPPAKSAPD